MINNILRSDETKIELFSLNAKHHICRKPGSIMLWVCFSAAGTGRLVRIEGKDERSKLEILVENLLRTFHWG